MSGTFNDIDVPPTLVSFAVDVEKGRHVITPELKKAGNKLVRFCLERDDYDLPVYEAAQKLYGRITELIREGAIVSAYALDGTGAAAALAKMAFGNHLGVAFAEDVQLSDLFENAMGDIAAEVPADRLDGLGIAYELLGTVTEAPAFVFGGTEISLDEMLSAWKGTLEKVFPSTAEQGSDQVESPVYHAKDIYVCKNKVARPTVFIPVFPGTNCEYDSAKAFERAGADVVTKVFRNLTAADIRESVDEFEKAIGQAQIIMFPGGFSAGDEPDGSAKFFATAFQNERSGRRSRSWWRSGTACASASATDSRPSSSWDLCPSGRSRDRRRIPRP